MAARQSAEHVRDYVLADRSTIVAEAAELAGLAAAAQALADHLASLTSPPADRKGSAATPRRQRATAARRCDRRFRGGNRVPGAVGRLGARRRLQRGQARVADTRARDATPGAARRHRERRPPVRLRPHRRVRRRRRDRRVVRSAAPRARGVFAGRRDRRRRDPIRGARLPASRHVVVVTNDKAIVSDVRAMGANTVSSDRFVALPGADAERSGFGRTARRLDDGRPGWCTFSDRTIQRATVGAPNRTVRKSVRGERLSGGAPPRSPDRVRDGRDTPSSGSAV